MNLNALFYLLNYFLNYYFYFIITHIENISDSSYASIVKSKVSERGYISEIG